MARIGQEQPEGRIQGRSLLGGKIPAAVRLPPLAGAPIRLRWRRLPAVRGREVHAASHLRRRLLELDVSLRSSPAETGRIVVHELFHFVWLRLGNPLRSEWSGLLAGETARGELGWSAEWRKDELTPPDRVRRSRRWREYVCESFCDTAAFLYAGVSRHGEFTLAARARRRRALWFNRLLQRQGGTLHL